MNDDVNTERATLTEAIRALREEVARLSERVAALEGAGAPAVPGSAANGTAPAAVESTTAAPAAPAPAAPAPVAAAPAAAPELSEELMLVISAAIAAFLGKKPYIRQIRLVTSPTWSHAGRVSIQASHALVHHRSGASL
jgi:methylmalonyl-CoA carboxyltransferase large subunit